MVNRGNGEILKKQGAAISVLPRQDLSLAMYNAMQARGFAVEAPICYLYYYVLYIFYLIRRNLWFKILKNENKLNLVHKILLDFFHSMFLIKLERKSLRYFKYNAIVCVCAQLHVCDFFLKLQFELEFFRLQNPMQYTK
jgi:hypothetical protein